MIKQLYTPRKAVLLLAAMLMVAGKLAAQITVTGPQCIIPGITYQYEIKGGRHSASGIKVSTTGGVFTSGISASTDRVKVSAVFVTWKDTAYHQIEVWSGKGKSGLVVQQTAPLNGGKLEADQVVRRYDTTAAGIVFRCSLPKGGACAPHYTYQWQKSEDSFKWEDLDNANEKDLLFSGKIEADNYFRRITTETRSNTVSYSDVGVLTVLHK